MSSKHIYNFPKVIFKGFTFSVSIGLSHFVELCLDFFLLLQLWPRSYFIHLIPIIQVCVIKLQSYLTVQGHSKCIVKRRIFTKHWWRHNGILKNKITCNNIRITLLNRLYGGFLFMNTCTAVYEDNRKWKLAWQSQSDICIAMQCHTQLLVVCLYMLCHCVTMVHTFWINS